MPTWFYSYASDDFWTDLMTYFSAIGNDTTAPPVYVTAKMLVLLP